MTRLSWNFLSYTIYFYHLLFRMKYNIFIQYIRMNGSAIYFLYNLYY